MNRRLPRLALCAALSLLVGTQVFAGGTDEASKKPQDLEITMLNTYFSSEPPPADHVVYKMIKDLTGATFKTTWIPAAAYSEKVNLALASGDLPMVINGKGETRKPNMLDAQRAGVFWELTNDVLSQCTYFLNNLDPKINNNLKVDGKLYVLYEERPVGRSATIYRKDWVDRLGLPAPYTPDDYDKVARGFTTKDLDGNGKQDTFGIFTTNGFIFPQVTAFAIAFGGVNGWKEQNGKFVPEFATPEYARSLDLFRTWYKDKVINPNFVALNATQDIFDAFQAQKTGFMLCEPLDDSLKQGAVLKLDPKAVVSVIPYMKTTDGKPFINGGTGHSGGFFFTKKGIKDKTMLVRVLKVFDAMAKPEGDVLNAYVWGLEGRHFTMVNGKRVQTAAQKELNNVEVMNFVQYLVPFDTRATWSNADVSQLQMDVINGWKANSQYAVMDPSLPLISTTYVEKGSQLDKIRKDAIMKYIMGELDKAGIDAAIKSWYEKGGTAMIAEYEAAFAKSR
jgi:putative aldouronate transport system substrate-binding protein